MPDPAARLRLAIVGYGKMGRLIDQLAPEFGFEVGARCDVDRRERVEGCDVAVEFSVPSAVAANVETLAAKRIPVVIGTTGWTGEMERVRKAVEEHGSAAVWSPNYSVGVNVFMRLAAEAARLLRAQPEYEAWGWEVHHSTKKDAPSGTMLKLVETMQSAGFTRPIDVSSNRAGAHPGTHEIGFDSPGDTITLRHVARGREGFARGALRAARWLHGRRGFFEFTEVLFGRD